jgi:hypothetical protein
LRHVAGASSQQHAAPSLRGGRRYFSTQRLYRELQFLGRTKCDLLACFDLDRFASCRIAPHSSWSLPDLKDAKTSNSNTFSLLEMLGNETNKIIEQRLSFSLSQLVLFGQAGRKVLESDWTTGRFCLSCHSFEPFIERESVERIEDRYDSWANEKLGPAPTTAGKGATVAIR